MLAKVWFDLAEAMNGFDGWGLTASFRDHCGETYLWGGYESNYPAALNLNWQIWPPAISRHRFPKRNLRQSCCLDHPMMRKSLGWLIFASTSQAVAGQSLGGLGVQGLSRLASSRWSYGCQGCAIVFPPPCDRVWSCDVDSCSNIACRECQRNLVRRGLRNQNWSVQAWNCERSPHLSS